MSNISAEELETMTDEELKKRALEEETEDKAKAEPEDQEPHPEPEEEPTPEPEPEESEPPVAQDTPEPEPPQGQTQAKDKDPLEWAKAKGFKSPEDMARALLQKDQEFHQSRQKGNREEPSQPSQVPNWNQPPQGYGYPPPPPPAYQPPPNIERLAQIYGVEPDDFEKVSRITSDITKALMSQERQKWESEIQGLKKQTQRQDELMSLMRDPAFIDPRVQKEMHEVLDSDPSAFQRERSPFVYAFNQAMTNLARKQLQQEMKSGNGSQGSRPPVTAGGGNGSAKAGPIRITEKEFLSWSEKDQHAFLESNGRKIPRK